MFKNISLLVTIFMISLQVHAVTFEGDSAFNTCYADGLAYAQSLLPSSNPSVPNSRLHVLTDSTPITSSGKVVGMNVYFRFNIESCSSDGLGGCSSWTPYPYYQVYYCYTGIDFYTFTGTGISSTVLSTATPQPEPNACESKKSITHGSVIDYNAGLVSEKIPIAGTNLELFYNSSYNRNLNHNKTIEALYSLVRDKGNDSRLLLLDPSDNAIETISYPGIFEAINYSRISADSAALISDTAFLKKYSYTIALERKFMLPSPTDLNLSNESTNWIPYLREPKDVLLYKPEVWGLGGWNLNIHHYLDLSSKTLFTGSGQTIQYQNIKEVTLPPYGTVYVAIERNNGNEMYVFDSLGRHLETRDTIWNKPIYKFTYVSGSVHRLTKVTDRYGLETIFNYDGSNNLTSIVAPYGQTSSVVISSGKILSITNPLSQVNNMTYGSNSQLITFEALNGVVTTFAYDTNGRFTSESKSNGLVQDFVKSISGAIVSLSHELNNYFAGYQEYELPDEPSEYSSIFKEYDSENRLISSTRTPASQQLKETVLDNELVSDTWTYGTYWGNDLAYDHLRTKTIPSLVGFSEQTSTATVREYTGTGDFVDEGGGLDAYSFNGRQILTTYDKTNLTISVLDNDNGQYGANRMISVNDLGQPTEVTRSGLPTKYYTYDVSHRLIKMETGDEYEEYSYDANGFLSQIENSKSEVTQFVRNAIGQVTQMILPNSETVDFEYTDGGELKKVTAPNGQIHNFSFSLGDYITHYLTPNSHDTEYDYDSDKRLIKITKHSGAEIEYNYKTNSANLETIEIPTGIRTFASIDSQGRILDSTSEDNVRLETSWISDQVQQQKWYDTDNSVLATLNYGFKETALVINSVSLNGTEFVNYGLGDIETGTDINSVGKTMFCSFSNYKLTVTCQDYAYPAFFSEVTTSPAVDNNSISNKLSSYFSGSGYNFIQLERNFNHFGQASVVESHDKTVGGSGYSKTVTVNPIYDANGRLIQADRERKYFLDSVEVSLDQVTHAFTYASGSNNNVGTYGHNLSSVTATHNNDDQLSALVGSVNRDYTYDDDGNLASYENCNGTTSFVYDVFGNLKQVTLPNADVITYKVDSLNRRVKKLLNGDVVEYYLWYDQTRLAAVLDEAKAAKVKYIYSIDSRTASMIEKDGNLYKIIHDPALGSVRYVVDLDTKEIAQEIEYDEAGNMLSNSNVDFQPLGYAGGLYDKHTKLTRFGARDYDPTIGRWTTKDASGFNGGDTNLYAYVSGNPMSAIDPTGLARCTFSTKSGSLVCKSNDGKKSYSTTAFSGGNMGTSPLPTGTYYVKADSKGNRDKFFSLSRGAFLDSLYKMKMPGVRGDFLLHPGTYSEGCVTVNAKDKDSMKSYNDIHDLIQSEISDSTLEVTGD